jgi:hypothetical protein
MDDQSNKQIQKVKKVVKKAIIAALRPIIIIFAIICIIVAFICSAMYVITLDTATLKDGSWDNVPYASDQYSNNVTIDENGIASTDMSAQEVWDKLIENNSNIKEYIKESSTFKKLLNAEMVTNFLDTRKDPDAEIDWDSLNQDTNSKEVQGIIKLKRATAEGKTITMVYTDPDTFQSYIDEYNATGSETAKQQALKHFTIERGYIASNFGNGASITAGTSVELPSGIGAVHSYMGWQTITSTTSNQYKLMQQSGMNFDEEGFGRINGRYVIACTSTYGNVGDYVDFYQEDGSVIQCIIGDIKNQNDTGCNEWGHSNGQNVIEFVVDKNSWYSTEKGGNASNMHINPGNQGCHPEWNQNITKVVNGGSYFDNPNFGAENISGNGTTITMPSTGTAIGSGTISSGNATINGEIMKWPVDSTNITSYFGPRNDPTNTSVTENHGAIDISVPTGANVYATEAGTVITARYGSETAGNYVEIDHGNGYISRYLHNSELKVKVGDKVTKGQVIALAGSTGKSTGPHCHFEIRYNGVRVDPLNFKYDNGMGNGMGGFGSNPDELSTTNKYYAKVATWTEIYDKLESNDPEVETYEKITYNMTTTRINYQEFVSGYTMPFEYLWSFLTVGQEEEFVSELADLVYGSEIFITVHDNLRINTNISTDTYTKMKKAIAKDVTVSVNYEDDITYYDDKGNPHTYTTGDTATKVGGPFENEQAFPYTTIHTVITSTNTLEIKLTEANVWIVEYKQEFTSQAPPKDEKSQDNPQKDQPYTVTAPTADHTAIGDALGESYRASVEASYSAAHTRASASLTGMNTEYYTAVVGRNIHVYTKTEGLIYVSSPATVREKVELTGDENNFVKIYTSPKHATTASNIHSAPDWLYLLLSQNSSTANMVDVTKYLLYKATDYDYGVQSYDFSVYKPENFKKLYDKFSNLDGVPGKVYNFLLSKGVSPAGAAAVLGNIQEASNFEANTTSSNGGNGLCLWKNDRFKNLQSWAKSNHKAWTGVTTQLEFMWSELESKYPSVKNKITGATEENLEYVTWYWGRFYEGFFVGTNFEKTKSNTAQRYMYAQQWLEKVK